MSDEPMTDAEVAQAFADHLDDLSRSHRQPLPGAAARLARILDDHEVDCVEIDREEAERERHASTA